MPAPIWLVNIHEDGAKAGCRRWYVASTGHEELDFSNVAPYGTECPYRTEHAEDRPVRGVAEHSSKPSWRKQSWISGGRSLHEPGPIRRRKQSAACDQKAREGVSGDRGRLVVVAPAVP